MPFITFDADSVFDLFFLTEMFYVTQIKHYKLRHFAFNKHM